MPVIPVTWEAEIGRPQTKTNPDKKLSRPYPNK
jgi:hypothetical protein